MALTMAPMAHQDFIMHAKKESMHEDVFNVDAGIGNADLPDVGCTPLLQLLESAGNPSYEQVMGAVNAEIHAGKKMTDILRTANAAGWPPLIIASQRGLSAAVKTLLELGADTHCREPTSGWTPLMYAVTAGNERIVRDLLSQGACPNEFAKPHDWNALAAAIVQNQECIMALLLEAGANPNLIKRRHPHLHETYLGALNRYQTHCEAEAVAKSAKPCGVWVRDYDQHC